MAGHMFTHDDEPSTKMVIRVDGDDDIANMSNLVIAHPGVGDLLSGKVGCQSRDRVIAAPEVCVLLAGVIGGSGPEQAARPQRHGPEQRIFGNCIPREELEWKQIGSGMWARSFIGMSRLLTTTKSGPHESNVHRRIIRDVDTGKVIDDCIPELVADEKLFRGLPEKRNIRAELVMKFAAKWFRHAGPDISEIYSPPRIVQEAGFWTYTGTKFRPGWSLDLTTNDPETGTLCDLSDCKVRTKVMSLIREGRPYMLICSLM